MVVFSYTAFCDISRKKNELSFCCIDKFGEKAQYEYYKVWWKIILLKNNTIIKKCSGKMELMDFFGTEIFEKRVVQKQRGKTLFYLNSNNYNRKGLYTVIDYDKTAHIRAKTGWILRIYHIERDNFYIKTQKAGIVHIHINLVLDWIRQGSSVEGVVWREIN